MASEKCFVATATVPKSSAWGTTLITDIEKAFDNVTKTLNSKHDEVTLSINNAKTDILVSVALAQDTANEALKKAKDNAIDLSDVKTMIRKLELCCDRLQSENNTLKEKVIKQEHYSRRSNLVFRGIQERQGETVADVKQSLRDCFVDTLGFDRNAADGMPFVRAHRLGQPRPHTTRPVIVKFEHYDDRESVWDKVASCRTSHINMSEDFPYEMSYRRGLLYPIFKAAKSSRRYNRVKIKNDTLIIDDTTYDVDHINQLPQHINPNTLSYKCDANTYVFGGIYSTFNPLSNWFQSSFTYNNTDYLNLEQAWQHQKAIGSGDMSKAKQILLSTDPKTAKRLGGEVKLRNKAAWDAGRQNLMTKLVRAKVQQSDVVKQHLKSTGNKKLGETGVNNNYYTVGMKLTDDNVLNSTAWKGKNLLGNVLSEIRAELG